MGKHEEDMLSQCADAVETLSKRFDAMARADASPTMIAFQERQAARKRAAEVMFAIGDARLDRAKLAAKEMKKLGGSFNPGRSSEAEHLVKRCRASFSLAITHGMSNSIEFDKWMATGNSELASAEDAVNSRERDVASRRK